MARDRCDCHFSFWAIFCPFTPQKSKFQKHNVTFENFQSKFSFFESVSLSDTNDPDKNLNNEKL